MPSTAAVSRAAAARSEALPPGPSPAGAAVDAVPKRQPRAAAAADVADGTEKGAPAVLHGCRARVGRDGALVAKRHVCAAQ